MPVDDVRGAGLRDLRTGFTGRVLTSRDAGYPDARRLFSSMVNKRPAVIAQCATVDDVVAAVKFGRTLDVPTAIRSGGHSLSGTSSSEGGLVIDVRNMKTTQVDVEAQTMRCGAGVTWGEFDAASQKYGLAVTGGRVSSTGVTGLTLGGGSGWLERKFGLTCDSLAAVELVTADGEAIRATPREHPDLFWALHGAGGNFGVVTALEFQLHPLGPVVLAGLMLWPAARGRDVILEIRTLIESCPDEVGLGFLYLTGPQKDFVPTTLRGELCLGVAFVYAGPLEEGESSAQVLRDLEPAADLVCARPYCEFQSMIDDPPGFRYYGSTDYLANLADEVIDSFIEATRPMPLGLCQSAIVPWGGAVPRDDTPMVQRDAQWVTHPYALWERPEDDERHIGWCRQLSKALEPFSTGGVYLNFIGDEGSDRIRAAFGETNYVRLRSIKAKYDPDNFFRLNQNIKPAGKGSPEVATDLESPDEPEGVPRRGATT